MAVSTGKADAAMVRVAIVITNSATSAIFNIFAPLRLAADGHVICVRPHNALLALNVPGMRR